MKITKRSGEEQVFDPQKVLTALTKANASVDDSDKISQDLLQKVLDNVVSTVSMSPHILSVEDVQDIVEKELVGINAYKVAKSYVLYRYQRSLARKSNTTDDNILSLVNGTNEEMNEENSNKNTVIAPTQRDYIAGIVSRDLTDRVLLPQDIAKAHEDGIIHFHDADYFIQQIHNCCLVNLQDMLQNGTVISGAYIDKPKSFSTACTIATQIIAGVASGQYGGQSISLTHLAPFVNDSRSNIKERMLKAVPEIDKNVLDRLVSSELHKEIERGIQTLQYQINTLMTSNGQTPFITVFMYLNEAEDSQTKEDLAMLIEEVFKQRIQGIKNDCGIWITPAFPKLIYVLEEDNITPDSKYWYLTELAAKCTAKRMVPDYISEKMMLSLKKDKNGDGHCYTCMGCRSFLTPYVTSDGSPKYYGRFNQGVVTINLPDVAMAAHKDIDKFWSILDERLELCHRALQCRHKRLHGTKSDVSPIHWQHGALARLKKGEVIDDLLHSGYSTLSLGYAGLWECVYALIGKKLTEDEGKDLGLLIMKKLNEYTAKWKADENIDYSLYGTPIETLTYKFAKALQKHWGIVPGVSDKNYVTNSYHVHVTEPIDAFEKLKLESEFQKLSPGGAISYVEVPNLQNNIPAVLSVIQYIYDHIMYAEINTKSDYCQVCGFDGEIKIVERDGKLVWECPKCGNIDQHKMNVARRTCGYIGTNFWNQGRTQEIKERVLHL